MLRHHVARMERVRREYVLLVTGAPASGAGRAIAADDVDARVRVLRAEGLGAREIAARLARETDRARREIYRSVLELGESRM